MSTAATLKRLYPEGTRPRPGAHCSDGMRPDAVWHFHDMHQLLYAFDGAVEIESARGRHLIPRQLAAWIPAGVAHRTRIQGMRSGSVFFRTDMVPHAGDRLRTVLVSALMREMIRESMRWSFARAEDETGVAFFAAMAQLCGEWIQQEADLYLPVSNDPRLQRALELTHSQPSASLADVCRCAAMSERTLRRHLQAEIGTTWEDFRRRSRLLQAVSLLSDTDVPIRTVASRCGFESQSAFAKAFRAVMGETPRNYRNQVRDPL
jgi:AraC-like DNA-binding protein